MRLNATNAISSNAIDAAEKPACRDAKKRAPPTATTTLAHACRSMPELYASPHISCLISLANRVLERMRTMTILRVANG